jgi:hypothetical protein
LLRRLLRLRLTLLLYCLLTGPVRTLLGGSLAFSFLLLRHLLGLGLALLRYCLLTGPVSILLDGSLVFSLLLLLQSYSVRVLPGLLLLLLLQMLALKHRVGDGR